MPFGSRIYGEDLEKITTNLIGDMNLQDHITLDNINRLHRIGPRNSLTNKSHARQIITQPAYNVGMTLIMCCIYVATSNNINATFSQRLVIDVTRTWKFDVATTLKSSRQPNPTSSQRQVFNIIRTWKFDIHATL